MTETANTNTNTTNDSTKFRMAVKMAMGLRTQKQFAEDIGTTPQYLSRLMSGTVRPTMKTLEHIAAHADNGITLQSLRKACGYNPKDNRSSAAIGYQPQEEVLDYQRAHDFGYVVGLAAAKMKSCAADSPAKYLTIVKEAIKALEAGHGFTDDDAVSYELIGDIKKDGQKNYQEADFTFRVPKYIARVKTVLSWFENPEDKKPHHFTLNTSARTLKQYFPSAIDPSYEDDPDVPFDQDSAYVERQILMPTFSGDPEEDAMLSLLGLAYAEETRVPTIEEGYGFYTDNVSEETALEFCNKYKEFWPAELTAPEDYTDEDEEEHGGVFGLIAYILRNMTGVMFFYGDPKDDLRDGETLVQDKPVIMVSEIWCDGNYSKYSRSTVLHLCGQYAAELGVKKYGSVWMQSYRNMQVEPEYKTVFPDKERIEEAKKEFAEDE